MAAPQTKVRALRCARVLARLARIGLGCALAAQVALLCLILTRGELPVPRFLLESVHKALQKEGYSVQWESLHVNLTGQVLVGGLVVGTAEGEHNTLLKAHSVLVGFSPLRALTGKFRPRLFVLEGAELICPVLISPTGEPVTLIDQAAANLVRSGGTWHIRQLQAQLFNVKVRSDGELSEAWLRGILGSAGLGAKKPDAAPEEKARPFLVRYRDLAHLLYSQRENLLSLDYPRISLQLSTASASIHSQESPVEAIAALFEHHKQPLQQLIVSGSLGISSMLDETLQLKSGPVQTTFSLALSEDAVLSVLKAPYASAESIRWKERIHAGQMIAVFPQPAEAAVGIEGVEQLLKAPLDKLGIYAWELNVYGYPLDHARLEVMSSDGADLLKTKDYLINASVQEGWNRLCAFGGINTRSRSGSLDFIADWNPDYLKTVAAEDLPRGLAAELDAIRFKHTPHLRGHMVFENGYQPVWAGVRLRSGSVEYGVLKIAYSHARASWDATQVVADGIVAHSADGYSATGRYWQSLQSDAYAIWAEGTINPAALNPLIAEEWWQKLWADFAFNPQHWPQASFAMAGVHGKGSVGKRIFVRARMEDFAYRGIDATHAAAILNMDGDRVDLYDFSLLTPKGGADLHLRWQFDGHERKYLALKGTGTLPIHDAALLVGPHTAEDLKDFTAEQPPRAALLGVLLGDHDHGLSEDLYLRLDVQSANPIAYDWIHMDSINAQVLVTPQAHDLPQFSGVLAGGAVEGSVRVERSKGEDMAFRAKLSVKGAHLDRLEDALTILSSDNKDKGSNGKDDGEDSLFDQPGLVDFEGDIAGVSGQMRSLQGAGTLDLRNSDLAQINVLGAISRLFQYLNMPIATLRFESAKTQWQLKDGIVHLPDLRITGNTAKISASGNIDLETSQIDFLIYLQPFGEVTFPVISQALWLLSPLSNLIQVQATGSLSDPVFSTSITPSGIFQGRQSVTPALPGSMEVPDPAAAPPVRPPQIIESNRSGRIR